MRTRRLLARTALSTSLLLPLGCTQPAVTHRFSDGARLRVQAPASEAADAEDADEEPADAAVAQPHPRRTVPPAPAAAQPVVASAEAEVPQVQLGNSKMSCYMEAAAQEQPAAAPAEANGQ